MTGVTLRSVEKAFGPVKTIHGVDLDVGAGEFVVFVGPSGCGKSTLLRMIAGLEEVTAGEIRIGGRVVNDCGARRARHRHGLPELRPLPAHDRSGTTSASAFA
jgi:ABC-type sugar transport system ATPase subunit